eukprot:CRZ06196.1 hypothetical protein [Spongospora subterranea]
MSSSDTPSVTVAAVPLVECLGGMQSQSDYVRLYEKYGSPHSSLVFSSRLGVMRVHSTQCNGRPLPKSKISNACKTLFADRVMRKRFERMANFSAAEKALERHSICELEIKAVQNLLHARDFDIPRRKELMMRAKS